MAQGDYLGIVMQSDIGAQGVNGVAAQSDLQLAAQTATTAKNDIDAIMTHKTIGPTALASFDDGVDGAILGKCVVNIEPAQNGSGDPSPTNVRPITGWTGAKINRYEKNMASLLDVQPVSAAQQIVATQTGINVLDAGEGGVGVFITKVCANRQYTLSFDSTNTIGNIRLYDSYASTDYDPVSQISYAVPAGHYSTTFTAPKDSILRMWINEPLEISNLQVEESNSETQFSSLGNVYSIAFPSGAGTVYGGTLDVGTGVLSVRPYYASYSGQSLIGPWISSHDVYTPGGTPTIGAQVVDMGGAEITYQLTPVQVRTLFGLNNIYADCGDVTVQVRGDVPNLYNNIYTLLNGLHFAPEAHRTLFRGKFLGTSLTAEQKAHIRDGSFYDLWLGDYWVINGIVWRIVDFDYWYNGGDGAFTRHHLVVMPDNVLYNAQMNKSNITEGGYIGSKMYTDNLAQAKTICQSAFGNALLTHRNMFVSAVTNGKASGCDWVDSTVDLPNEIMMYGTTYFRPSNDGVTAPKDHTIDKSQLALMQAFPKFISPARQHQWLRDVVSATNFAVMNNYVNMDSYPASYSLGVRPPVAVG